MTDMIELRLPRHDRRRDGTRPMTLTIRRTTIVLSLEWAWSFYAANGPGLHMSAVGPLHLAIYTED